MSDPINKKVLVEDSDLEVAFEEIKSFVESQIAESSDSQPTSVTSETLDVEVNGSAYAVTVELTEETIASLALADSALQEEDVTDLVTATQLQAVENLANGKLGATATAADSEKLGGHYPRHLPMPTKEP